MAFVPRQQRVLPTTPCYQGRLPATSFAAAGLPWPPSGSCRAPRAVWAVLRGKVSSLMVSSPAGPSRSFPAPQSVSGSRPAPGGVEVRVLLHVGCVLVAGFHGLVQQFQGPVGVLLLPVGALAAGDGVDAGKVVPLWSGP